MIAITAARWIPRRVATDVVAWVVPEDAPSFRDSLAHAEPLMLRRPAQIRDRVFQGKPGQTLWAIPASRRIKHLLLLGIGPAKSLTLERLRRTAAQAVKAGATVHARTLTFVLPSKAFTEAGQWEVERERDDYLGAALAEGVLLGAYRYERYLTAQENRQTVRTVHIAVQEGPRLAAVRRGVARGRIIAEGTALARDLANAPANDLSPATLAARAREAGRSAGFRVNVFTEARIRALGMGGLLGVASGSHRPPRFLVMEYNRRGRGTVVLVGKGVTFDSGGISIKPAANMAEMKMDMAGAAAVIGTMSTAARLRIPVHLVGLVPATENLPGGSAMRPGDILRHLNGITSEVDNTDAEGRLILADALAYADRYAPELIIDLATLTGAVVVALGHVATGMLGNDGNAMQGLRTAGLRSYERVWELPMFEEYERLIKSDIADVKNTGGRWAGAISAAMFLRKFVGDRRWVHLDIAGTAIMEEAGDYIPRGGSGVGVRLLTEFLRSWKKPRPRSPSR